MLFGARRKVRAEFVTNSYLDTGTEDVFMRDPTALAQFLQTGPPTWDPKKAGELPHGSADLVAADIAAQWSASPRESITERRNA
jgi:hypothetical protein